MFCSLTVARDILLSIQQEDMEDNFTLLPKAQWFSYAFIHLHDLLTLKTTDSRKSYLAAKRREKRAGKEFNTQKKQTEAEDEDDEAFPVETLPPLVAQG